ncbi:flagellar hook-associated protein FlgK [Candidatus Sulfurimonas marisnigri]|uniref:Flagellar hook-associated protein 1 n=1 Tax=Candidatus Sulfurimonas marisnigri TaxID=2740405 RepID=A0A7S7M293_9BACT|nr:flagellar hook-associated protein FlgK [Candidatus Sulfurimonas marisnigri]QOY55203.1 flagellar hook-associated protein FlgK [Candidatus Sulfurimonas marisnigri]
MPSIFSSLNIGYTGLSASQVGIDTTAHNISNADSDGYTRQRVVTTAATPINSTSGNIGNGTEILAIERIFDNFVFDRYVTLSSDKEFSDYEKKTLQELSSYFPEIDNVGIKASMQEYYNMWQSFSDNPDNDAIKLALAKQTEALSDHITQVQNQVTSLQAQINDELAVNVNEVNSLAKELSELNLSIATAENGSDYTANDLRDKRNVLERDLSRLIGSNVNSGLIKSNINIDSSSNIKTETYLLSVNGFNIVDGNTFHPIHISKASNPKGFYEISYERQDGTLLPMAEKISGGKIGAILDLRGGAIDTTSGLPVDGTIQNVVSELDAFAQALIEATNNLYAQTPTTKMESNPISGLIGSDPLLSSSLNFKEGTFDLIIYDIDGNEASRRSITIDPTTTMTGPIGSNSIEAQIGAQIDDNNDGNANNDIDNFFKNGFNFVNYASGDSGLELSIDPLSKSKGYTFSIEDTLKDGSFDSGTNFAGVLGLNRFFDGNSAKNIDLNLSFKDNPTLLSSGYSSTTGDNRLALDMIQQQFEKYDFNIGSTTYNSTMYGMFDIIATEVGTATNSAMVRNDTVTAQFNATEMEYSSVSKVSMDEEMTNLIRYQTAYGAAAKIITTIDQMMQTLLGIKQ